MKDISNYKLDVSMLHQNTQILWHQINDLLTMLNSQQYHQAEVKLNQYHTKLDETVKIMRNLKRLMEDGFDGN